MNLNFLKRKNSDESISQPYVDLGLPSGTLWAAMNIGAEKVTDAGLYFAWGETQGYLGISNERRLNWDDYKFGNESEITKYNSTDMLSKLELVDDAASVNWGGKWRMPTVKQIRELLNPKNCTNEWVENYNGSGVNGRLFSSVRNGNKLFVPAAGYHLAEVGKVGWIWSCELNDEFERAAQCLAIGKCNNPNNNHRGAVLLANDRCIGIPVRPVFE